ncbi:threonyl-tRNA synthetase [Spiroplasma sabaudiense Ar-1343]|uniref:Threonine--tRNA ligase n=1 Tax=Spiroplasma sabaudiense Ar-1343 TaxID=1276257 RepID=W6A9B0_9MOLU|nr:threonine--tRNA ligase [Spiroplasma sabaudiense]AHI53566.1 threonyl-tRNA synthetase [Spiroplasma sabaudiense Ar-1343]
MKITLLDGSIREFSEPKSVKEIATSIATSLGKKAVGGIVDEYKIVPSDAVIYFDCQLEIITERHEQYLNVINHTAALVTALAIKELHPKVNIAEIFIEDDDEFALTFNLEPRLKIDSLAEITKQAEKIIKENITIEVETIEPKDFKKVAHDNPLLEELMKVNLCANGNALLFKIKDLYIISKFAALTSTGELKIAESQQLSGSYFLGSEKNKMLQRINGMGGVKAEDFKTRVAKKEERKANDHRKIGKDLEIFHLDQLIGQGLPIWLPNGTILKQEIKKYLMEKEWEYDFVQIETPVIGSSELYKTSGHWDHYRDDMFAPMTMGNEELVLKPMSCPHHVSVYRQQPRSYRDLPIRYAEHALQHRYESSGSLTGLERVRAMELTDSHIFVRPDQLKSEFKRCFNLITEVLRTFDIQIDYLSLSLRDPKDKEKYFPDDNMWNKAEAELEDTLKELNLVYKTMIGEAAFYGPKLDIQIRTALNHEITVSTLQLDFLLPEKFDLNYINPINEEERPIMIHRGLIGTYERFISVLLEQTKGVLPLWCSPKQIKIIPVNIENDLQYCEELKDLFKKEYLRTEIDLRDERLNYKIRDAQINKIPFQLVIGKNEAQNKTVTYRRYGSEEQITVSVADFLKLVKQEIVTKGIIV